MSLGEGIPPSHIVDAPTQLGLLEPLGLLAKPPHSELATIQHGFSKVTGGGKSLSGGVQRFRLVLALQPAG
jgi:hypothetical protein